MDNIVYHAHRRKAACTQTGDALDGKQAIGGHAVVRCHAGAVVKRLLDIRLLADMACRTVADLDDILALGVE